MSDSRVSEKKAKRLQLADLLVSLGEVLLSLIPCYSLTSLAIQSLVIAPPQPLLSGWAIGLFAGGMLLLSIGRGVLIWELSPRAQP